MAELFISCVKKDTRGVVTNVGINGTSYPVLTVVQWLLDKTHTAYTYERGQKAKVYPRKSINGNWFLTTKPDSTTENNLDFLDVCTF